MRRVSPKFRWKATNSYHLRLDLLCNMFCFSLSFSIGSPLSSFYIFLSFCLSSPFYRSSSLSLTHICTYTDVLSLSLPHTLAHIYSAVFLFSRSLSLDHLCKQCIFSFFLFLSVAFFFSLFFFDTYTLSSFFLSSSFHNSLTISRTHTYYMFPSFFSFLLLFMSPNLSLTRKHTYIYTLPFSFFICL